MPVRGRFYLTKLSTGDLVGEFSHNRAVTIFQENAVLTTSPPVQGGFPGTYLSTWDELDGNGLVHAVLNIEPVEGSLRLFNLSWNDQETRTPMFTGQAMLANGMLIGDYQSA